MLKFSFIVWPVEAGKVESREERKPQCCYWGNATNKHCELQSFCYVKFIYLHLLCILVQILQVAPSLHMVEVRKAKGDTLEFHKVTTIHAMIMLIKKKIYSWIWTGGWRSGWIPVVWITEIHNLYFVLQQYVLLMCKLRLCAVLQESFQDLKGRCLEIRGSADATCCLVEP
jgi:hypothetical protein